MSPSAGGTLPRVVCFIDGSNFHGHLKTKFGNGRVRFPQICQRVVGMHRKLEAWRYYAAPLPQGTTQAHKANYAGQRAFFASLQNSGGVVRLARFQKDASGTIREKGVDVLIAVDLVRLAAENKYDVAILFSGDADLVPAIETVQEVYHKEVEVALPDVQAYHVRSKANRFIEINERLFRIVEIK